MLKLLNGIFWPDKSKITIKGEVGALIEVGAGFHPLLTGRENVYINAAILGMTKKEVDEKFDSIEEFADIGDFIDAPVKYYEMARSLKLESIRKKEAKSLEDRVSSGEIEYIDSGILNDKGEKIDSIGMDEPLNQFCDFKLEKDVEELSFSMGILDEQKRTCIWSISTDNNKVKFRHLNKGKCRVIVRYKKHHLMPRAYIPNVAIRNNATGETYERILPKGFFKVTGNFLERGIVHAEEKWKLEKL